MSWIGIEQREVRAVQCSFRPVAMRLPLLDVAALADAMARALLRRPAGDPRPIGFGFRLRLSPAARLALAEGVGAWAEDRGTTLSPKINSRL